MRLIASFAWGIVLGTASVLVHNAYPPYGIALAIGGSSTGIWMIGRAWGSRRLKIVGVLGWVALVYKASTSGVGNELLVQGNTPGNALVVGGIAALLITVSLRTN